VQNSNGATSYAGHVFSLFQYESGVHVARSRFPQDAGLARILDPDVDPLALEAFLIHFCSLGVALTEPVEGWLTRSSERCTAIGMTQLGRALLAHSKAESGHHLMMIRDTHALVARWNSRRRPTLDAEQLLACPPTPGGWMYRQLHEDTIASDTPFAQIAIEYEIERLPVEYGKRLIEQCVRILGADIMNCLSFVDEHITLDVGHSKFNARQLEGVLDRHPTFVEPLVEAGSRALTAYSTFLRECVDRGARGARGFS
jgi:hypothetical protein